MHHRLIALLLAVLTTSPVAAAPYTPHFDALRAELEARVASGTLEPKQERAASKALAAIDGSSSSLAGDLRIAGKVLKRLGKAFADELGGGAGLGALVAGLKAALVAEVEDEAAALEGTAAGLADGACRGRVDSVLEKVADKVSAAEGAANPIPLLTRALRFLGKGTSKAGTCEPSGSVTTTSTSLTTTSTAGGSTTTSTLQATCDGNTLTVSVNDAPFVPEVAQFYRGDDVQSVVVYGTSNTPGFSELSLVAWDVSAPGSYPVNEFSSWVENGDVTFQPPSPYTVTGTMTVTTLSPTCVAGSFDVTFTAGAGTRHVTGTFELTETF